MMALTNQTTEIADNMVGKELAAILTRCKAGDSKAWDALISMYEMPVYKFAYSLCHNHDDAEDIVGQVFLRVYLNLNSFRYEAAFTAWLFRIVKNAHIDLCLRARHTIDVSMDIPMGNNDWTSSVREVVDPQVGPEQLCIENETSSTLFLAIKCLPAIQRKMMHLYHMEGRSYAEIAEYTNISIGTVKSRLNRARTMLRERLDPAQQSCLMS
jgi:RNA polymerase sigma-70 factor (ECF subfamily)